MVFIIIVVVIFFVIAALTNDDEVSPTTMSKEYIYNMTSEGKFIYLKFGAIPADTDIVYVEITYQSQAVKSCYDFFNDNEDGFLIGAHNDGSGNYIAVIPANTLMLPRNKEITLEFNITLIKNETIIDKPKFQETATISSSPFILMEWFVPAINIFGYYAIKKGDSGDAQSWTTENIKTIKSIFAQYIDMNQQEQDFLKNQIKSISKRPIHLKDCVKEFNIRANSMADRNALFYTSARIMLNNVESGKWRHIEKAISEIEHLGKLLSVSKEVLEDVYSAVELFKNQTQNSSTDTFDTLKALNILGLSEGATIDQMRRAYRLKIKDFHPDKYTSLPDAVRLVLQEKAQELNLAKETLRF